MFTCKSMLLCLFLVLAVTAPTCVSAADDGPGAAAAEFADEFEDEFGDEFGDDDVAGTSDPLIRVNRAVFTLNDRLYFWILKPVATGYGKAVPEGGRLAVGRFFKNLRFPVRLVNNLLQFKLRAARTESLRFGVNSTVGVLGLFDPARSRFELEPQVEDFGQTMGHYGVGTGVPLVLPLLGPTNVRDAVGLIPDYLLDPVSYIDSTGLRAGVRATDQTNNLSLHLGDYESLKRDALDPYILLRDAQRQNREKQVED